MINSKEYWESRYRAGGNSGAGSYGLLAEYKATIINAFIDKCNIENVVEFGCGDGNQLSLLKCKYYTGFDVSQTVIFNCRHKFKEDPTKSFYFTPYKNEKYDLALSLDVIYHLIEDDIFEEYMRKLFQASQKYVIIYSSNGDVDIPLAKHLLDRKFTDWIDNNIKDFKLIGKIDNPYKYKEGRDATNTSISDFYFYEKIK